MTDDLYTATYIEKVLDGYWFRKPSATWTAERVCISKRECQIEAEKRILFIAIDEETWAKGSQNKGIYAGWKDTHKTILQFQDAVSGIIAQRPIEELDENIPQFIVDNSYASINTLAQSVFDKRTGKTIAITGTAGKSTSKNLLTHLLSKKNSTLSTRGNHNTRTGVPMTIANAVSNPDYLVIESAISGLWKGKQGILESYPPDIGLITSIDGGQKLTPKETALYKARIAISMKPNSILLLNRDMLEYETVYNEVKDKQLKILTYGFHKSYDSYIISLNEIKEKTSVTASILGEQTTFTTSLLGTGMIYNIIAVLTIIKLLGHDLEEYLPYLESYQTGESVLQFEEVKINDNKTCTILDDSWNATGIAMVETISVLNRQSKYFKGKKIAILGRIENLGKDAERQHKLMINPIIDSSIDLVFAHGPEMKYVLAGLPENRIGGYFESARELAQNVSRIVENDDIILIKGSPRSSDFKHAKKHLIQSLKSNLKPTIQTVNYHHPHATGYGSMTIRLSDNKIVRQVGDLYAVQNEGLGNVLLIHHILNKVFDRKLDMNAVYEPTQVEIKENKSPNALPFKKNNKVLVKDLISASIVSRSPNALLLLANQVLKSNRETMKILRKYRDEFKLNKDSVHNITGRRISNKKQAITLDDLIKVGKILFDKQPSVLSQLRESRFFYEGNIYDAKTNLFEYGSISHGLFFGHNDSIALTMTRIKNDTYLTAVIGAPDAFKRDILIMESLKNIETPVKADTTVSKTLPKEIPLLNNTSFKINFLGDTYFGEFYTKLRNRRGREDDALTTYGRDYSFSGIQSFFSEGNYNIVNFEAVLSDGDNDYLRERKRYTLHADPIETIPALKRQNIHAVTLATNHLMDFGEVCLQNTLSTLKSENITTLGAGNNLTEAENNLVLHVNGKRIAIFNGYWYRHPMYRDYDFYAFHDKPGVSSLSGNLIEKITEERKQHPDSMIVVVAHWGVDFERVRRKQRAYAKAFSNAGANVIIGHGAHLMQEIEYYNETLIVYSIGNGVFNSDGEYNRRGAPPYSFIAQLKITENSSLHLYPIYTNNLQTFWRPRFINDTEAEHIDTLLKTYNNNTVYNWNVSNEKHYINFPIK